jgi:hypothetical protein
MGKLASELEFQSIVSQLNSRRQLEIDGFVLELVGQMGKVRPARFHSINDFQCLVQAEVGGMGLEAQGVNYEDA